MGLFHQSAMKRGGNGLRRLTKNEEIGPAMSFSAPIFACVCEFAEKVIEALPECQQGHSLEASKDSPMDSFNFTKCEVSLLYCLDVL